MNYFQSYSFLHIYWSVVHTLTRKLILCTTNGWKYNYCRCHKEMFLSNINNNFYFFTKDSLFITTNTSFWLKWNNIARDGSGMGARDPSHQRKLTILWYSPFWLFSFWHSHYWPFYFTLRCNRSMKLFLTIFSST